MGSAGQGPVTCVVPRAAQLPGPLLARWDAGDAAPWLIRTDGEPEVAEAAGSGMRSWMEGGFQDRKRGGWQWHQPKLTDPARASR